MSTNNSIRLGLESVVRRELGEATGVSVVERIVDALLAEEPWAPAGTVGDLVNRDGVAKILGVGARSVSEYALRDPEFPKPETTGRLWSAQKIHAYQKMRKTTRSPGRPKGATTRQAQPRAQPADASHPEKAESSQA